MLKINYIKTSELIPYVNNTRTHSKEQVQQIASSIKEFGFTNPLLLDEQNGIIAGHGRLMAAKLLKMEEVPTIILSRLTEAQKKAYIIADNKLALNAGWDEELLKIEIENLQEMNFDIDLLGFSLDELGELGVGLNDKTQLDESKADEVPEIEDNPIIKLGDLIELGHNFQHRLLCGDSTKEEDVNRLMDGKKADMVFTDPPYGMFLDTDYSQIKGSAKSIGFKGNKTGNKYDKIIGDNDDFTPELITTIFKNFGYAKEIFVFGADYFIDLIPNYGKDGCLLVWNKRSSDEQQKGIGNTFEMFYSKVKHKKYVFNFEWFGFLSKDAPQEARNRVHPSMKPVGLIEKIWLWYKIDERFKNIVDVYGGSGSTLIAGENTNKHCYLMELDEKYAQVIIQRYVDYTSNPKIKINGVEVDWYEYKENKKGTKQPEPKIIKVDK